MWLFAPAAARSVEQASLGLGVGLHVPFDQDEREVYHNGFGVSAAYTRRTSTDGRSRVVFETSWLTNSGEEIVADPTFEVQDARYDLLQLGVGLRQNAVSDPNIGTAFWMGAGVLNVLSWWRDPLGQRAFGNTVGFYLELSPEIPVGEHWRVWVRTRLQVVADVEYGDYAPLDYNSSTLDAGVTHVWF